MGNIVGALTELLEIDSKRRREPRRNYHTKTTEIDMSAFLISACCFAQTMTPSGAAGVPPAAHGTEDSPVEARLEATLAALRVYESSLDGLAWEQSITVQPLPRGSGDSFVGFKSRFVVVPDGRWSLHSRKYHKDGERRVEVLEQFLFDGTRILAASPVMKSGVIRGRDGAELHESLLSPLMLIKSSSTERVISPATHRLSDKLAQLKDIAVDEKAAPLVRLSGLSLRGDKWDRLEVDLDPARGFMPTRITRTLELFDLPREELKVLSAENIGGTWVPTAGTRIVYGLDVTDEIMALSEEQQEVQKQELDRRMAAEGLRMEAHRDQRRIGAIMVSIAKCPILKTHPLGGSSDILRAWNIRKVTLTEADAALEQPFHEGDRVVDSRTGEQFVFRLGTLEPVVPQTPSREDASQHPEGAP